MTDALTVSGFWLFALLMVGGAVMMLASKNVVHAAFWLLAVSVSAAGIFFLLHADYVALVQLLVYSVAVAVLMLFTIMITLRRLEDAVRPRDFSAIAAAVGALFGLMMIVLLVRHPWQTKVVAFAPDIARIGRQLFSLSGWALPFEIASVLLTAALVGAVWWAREDDK